MKWTHNWLKDYLDTTAAPEEIADKLTMIGLEIEEIENPAEALKDFIVGEILSVEKHPNADKLNLLKVNDGTKTLNIVCGAPNVRKGLKGILARPGNIIPESGWKFAPAKIRGEESQGMMCSCRELKVGSDHNGIIDIPSDIKCEAGESAVPVLEKMFGIDTIYDGEITPNRADYLGVRGIAYDLQSAGLGTIKKEAETLTEIKETFANPINVKIKNSDACPMFATYYIKGIKNCESPQWLKDRLEAVGINPKSALVDITNYICFDMARPLHVFDAKKISGSELTISTDSTGKLKALDDNEYEVKENDITISDAESLVSIAGIMGGYESGCTEETTDVILESALFDPIKIRQTAARLKVNSDAKYRFERFIDPASTIMGIKKAAKLIQEVCGGEISTLNIVGKEPKNVFEITYPISDFKTLIGIDCPKEEMIRILKGLGCEVSDNGNKLKVTTPSHRGDLHEAHDITEEIIRIYGYDKIPLVTPEKKDSISCSIPLANKREAKLRRVLASRGLTEIISWEFANDEKGKLFGCNSNIKINNPIISEYNVMRESLLPNIVSALSHNLAKGYKNLSFFEVGEVFYGEGNPEEQSKNIAGIRSGLNFEKSWNGESREVNIYDIKNDLLSLLKEIGLKEEKLTISQDESFVPVWAHNYRGASVLLGKKVIATFGQLHPNMLKAFGIKRNNLFAFELYLNEVPSPKAKKQTQKALLKKSDLQPLYKDLAFILDKDTKAGDLIKEVYKTDRNLISNVNIFDVYEGENLEGKKSIALSVEIDQGEKTLTDKDIALLIETISNSVKKTLNGELRDK
ncbi:MAG: phenylalanine--tRNA ligase subunit beta [Alphaproteobacteria bacterium]|jgi:phenylalanyl-tRNA synthetase beta chain|nr:phenylalanine--tRNA ligase subunit beta [Alphaproteobacteria bacterium]